MMFGRVFEHFTANCTNNDEKRLFRGWTHYFDIPNFRKKILHEHVQSTPLDAKRCLRLFQSISLCSTSNTRQNGVFRYPNALFQGSEVQTNVFRYEWTQSTPLGPRWCLRVFWSISWWTTRKTTRKGCFGSERTISTYRTFGIKFYTNASNLLH